MRPRLRRGFFLLPVIMLPAVVGDLVLGIPGGTSERIEGEDGTHSHDRRYAARPDRLVDGGGRWRLPEYGNRVRAGEDVVGGGGNEFTGGGSSTILSLLPEGSTVKKGDVLCTLDSSAYEEMLRQQQIVLERAQAELRQAELELDVARLAVGESKMGCSSRRCRIIEAGSPWPGPTSREAPTDWNGRSGCWTKAMSPPAR